jgi:hypothetical protein
MLLNHGVGWFDTNFIKDGKRAKMIIQIYAFTDVATAVEAAQLGWTMSVLWQENITKCLLN